MGYIKEMLRYLQLGKHLVALGQKNGGVVNELINDTLGGLLLVDHSSDLAHQIWAGVLKIFVINVIGDVLHVVLNRDDTLGSKLLDLLGTVVLPVEDVLVLAHTQGTPLGKLASSVFKIQRGGSLQ